MQAPEPILGLDTRHVDARRAHRREVLTSVALFVSISSVVLLIGTMIILTALRALPTSTEGRARISMLALSLMLGGFGCIPTGYVLGACASGTTRGEKAKTIALTTLVGFLVVGMICVLAFPKSDVK